MIPETPYEGTFNITESTYVEHLWYLAGDRMDLLALLYRDTPEADWRLTYRFRHYSEDSTDPFDGKDQKRAYVVKAGNTDAARDQLRSFMDDTLRELATHPGVTMSRSVPVQGGSRTFMTILAQQPFAHVKVVATEGATVQ